MVRNRYAGVCYRCGERVPPGAGHFECVKPPGSPEERRFLEEVARLPYGWKARMRLRLTKTTWLIQHPLCAIRWRGTPTHYRAFKADLQEETDNRNGTE